MLLLAAWWVLNLLQAAFTGLSDDESYYWYFSQHLDWGYYDHPPMVALLVWLSSWLPGLLGIRFVPTLLQPLYLLLFWHLIKPADATRRDALLYVLICFAQPLLQLYGFLALPDAPLMMGTVLFFWAYRRFCDKDSLPNALLLGVTVALLGYSKYHGALLVALVLLSNPKLFLRPRLYLAGVAALLLFLPHLWWQYSHDWASIRYHLSGRNAWGYKFSFTTEYLATVLVLFNPLLLWHLFKGVKGEWRVENGERRVESGERRVESGERRVESVAGIVVLGGFVLFFLAATLRGRVQPQWLLPVVFPVVAFVFRASRRSKYVRTVTVVCAVLFCAVRLLAVTNPMHLKGQLWEGDEPYRKLATLADGRPVQFIRHYSFASKYAYYTGNPTHCTSYFYDRDSQWQYDTTDRTFAGREVLVAALGDLHGERLEVEAKRDIRYLVVENYRPMRELTMEAISPLDIHLPILHHVDTAGRLVDSIPPFRYAVRVTNPYPYDIVPDTAAPIYLRISFQYDERHASTASALLTDTLRAHTTTVVEPLFKLPAGLESRSYVSCLAIGGGRYSPPAASPSSRVVVECSKGEMVVKGVK